MPGFLLMIIPCLYQQTDKNLYLFLKQDSGVSGADIQLEEKTEASMDDNDQRKIICANCKTIITSVKDKMEISSKHQHTFYNPQGYVYNIRCYKKAPGCMQYGYKTSEFTWFPGYAWQIALCSNCNIHLGWKYDSGSSTFYGLIFDKLIEE